MKKNLAIGFMLGLIGATVIAELIDKQILVNAMNDELDEKKCILDQMYAIKQGWA